MKEEQALAELTQKFDVHQNQIFKWKKELLEHAQEIFTNSKQEAKVNVKDLHAKIGELTLENDLLSVALMASSADIRNCQRQFDAVVLMSFVWSGLSLKNRFWLSKEPCQRCRNRQLRLLGFCYLPGKMHNVW